MSKAKLTRKQNLFVNEYLVDLNASRAGLRAGYKHDNYGLQLVRKDHIRAAIAKAMETRAKRTNITADRVLAEYAKIAFSKLGDAVAWGPAGIVIVESSNLDDDTMACVKEVSESISASGSTTSIKMHDKIAALNAIARHLGMFDDKLRVDLNVTTWLDVMRLADDGR